jgi:hypothetical protein
VSSVHRQRRKPLIGCQGEDPIDRDLKLGPISITRSTLDRATPESGGDPGQRILVDGVPWIDWLQWRFLLPEHCSLHERQAIDAGDGVMLRFAAGTWQLNVRRWLRRELNGFCDVVGLHNLSPERLSLSVELNLEAKPSVTTVTNSALAFGDGSHLLLDALAAARPDGADWELALEPAERIELRAKWRTAP